MVTLLRSSTVVRLYTELRSSICIDVDGVSRRTFFSTIALFYVADIFLLKTKQMRSLSLHSSQHLFRSWVFIFFIYIYIKITNALRKTMIEN